ncbi:MAG TPA: hypothetical protein GXX50_09055 [Firmicutes bacterium]|nr:hypothetical protein [Bacillota bacterium]
MVGWKRHQHFGLRREWVDSYLANRQGWREGQDLGNRQIESLATWLKTAGIEDEDGGLIILGEQLLDKGTTCLPLWEVVWVNVVFNFPTARWYVHLGLGEWSTVDLRMRLMATVLRLKECTANVAVMELTGLLEHTPVGEGLQQGVVTPSRPRRVLRRGKKPCDAALVHAVGRVYLEENCPRLLLASDLTWPWVIFGCSRNAVLGRLSVLGQDWFTIDEHGVTILKEDKEWWRCGAMLTTLL